MPDTSVIVYVALQKKELDPIGKRKYFYNVARDAIQLLYEWGCLKENTDIEFNWFDCDGK